MNDLIDVYRHEVERMGLQANLQRQRRFSIVKGVDKLVQPELLIALSEIKTIRPKPFAQMRKEIQAIRQSLSEAYDES